LNRKLVVKLMSVGLANQMISSATNFSFGLYLLRSLTLEEFGFYNIAFAIMLFFGGFGQGFFLLQMVVYTPGKSGAERTDFAARILLLLIFACLAGLALTVPLVLLLKALTGGSFGLDWFVILVGVMSAAFMIKEFHIRHAFNEDKGARAVAVHAYLALSLLTGVLLQRLNGSPMTLQLALIFYAGSHVIAAIVGHVMAGLRLTNHSRQSLLNDLREIAGGGRWASATNVVYFLRGQAHTIVVAALLGPVSVAKINAARLLVTPAVLAIPALGHVALPRLAALAATGERQVLQRMQRKIGLGLLTIAFGYCALLLTAWPILSEMVLGEAYGGLFWIMALWCLYALCLALRNGIEWGAQVLKMFRYITAVSTLSAIVALSSVAVLTGLVGLEGAVIGVIAAEVVLSAGLWLILRK
jgi:O-antigen/teichoic acid export membrane protein